MRTYTVNYRKRDGARTGRIVNVGFWLHGVPRLILGCRLFGHRPVVDGTGEFKTDSAGERFGHVSRWVVCDRCGVRGDPQGSLDPQQWHLGQRYTGPWAAPLPADGRARREAIEARKGIRQCEPGRIPLRERTGDDEERPLTGTLGGQLTVGPGGYGGLGWELKVGNCGSEQVLAASLHLGPLGALYLHTEDHGTWLQRRLNPVGYESRITGVRLWMGRLEWRVWSKRDSASRYGDNREPWWRNGEVKLDPRDKVLGKREYSSTDVGGPVGRFVRMAEGDYLVILKLQRRSLGRARGRTKLSWNVDWSAAGKGIPTKGKDRGRIYGSGVTVSEAAVRAGTWPSEAVAQITADMVRDRTRYGWEPLGGVVVDPDLVPA